MITVEKMVRDIRILTNVSQSQLAKHLGIHKQMVSNFEREVCKIPLKYFSKISELLGISLNQMIELRITNQSQETRQFFE